MKFKTKIWMLPVCAAAVFVVGCLISYAVGTSTSATLERLRQQDYPALEVITKIERNVENFRLTLQAAAAEGDEDKLKDLQTLAAATLGSVDALANIEGQGELAAQLRQGANAYQNAGLGAIGAMLGKKDVGDQLTQMQKHMAALDGQIAASKQQAAQTVESTQDALATGVRRSLMVVLGTCLAALLTLGVASKLIVASVWKDLGDEPTRLSQAMRSIAEGDLSPGVASAAAGAHVGSMSAALGGMVAQLRRTIGQIRQAVESINTASSEIASGNQDLSARTESTASNLQQTASAMEQLTSTVGQTAESAVQARTVVGTAAQAAQRGGDIVTQVVTNMTEINAASRKITDIIGVIDGIAFQTNILALNAAVEAARAGEQGRGFAVVASEVRSLAQRSAQAAKEIKTLIGVSSEKVESGTQLVNDAGAAMREIVAGVQNVTSIIAEISDAASEQSLGIGNVNQAVAQLDQMTQQNSALVEQSAAAAGSLREQAQQLADAVAVFRVGAAFHQELKAISH
ncbi:MAG: methyl-accepting chemotaxis protein [Acidovorax sp.]|uniref:methyl-accepting chemotaxis protein n=1 Tax=Acidovorax sp. TaxID=1872122 RepID=UPI0039E249E7